jgi:hypothetical protein
MSHGEDGCDVLHSALNLPAVVPHTHLNVADTPPSVLYSDGFWLGGSHVCAFSIAMDS